MKKVYFYFIVYFLISCNPNSDKLKSQEAIVKFHSKLYVVKTNENEFLYFRGEDYFIENKEYLDGFYFDEEKQCNVLNTREYSVEIKYSDTVNI